MLTRAFRRLFIAIAAAAAVLAPSGPPLGFLPGWAPWGRTAAEVPTSTAVPRVLCGGRSGSCSRRHRGGLGRAAYKVTIHTVSKPENKGWEAAAVDEYSKRLATAALPINVETIFHKADPQLLRAVERTDHPIVVLDERGAELTSVFNNNYTKTNATTATTATTAANAAATSTTTTTSTMYY